jgi:hypothetical protein
MGCMGTWTGRIVYVATSYLLHGAYGHMEYMRHGRGSWRSWRPEVVWYKGHGRGTWFAWQLDVVFAPTGSVVVDLSAEAGGNTQYTKAGEVITTPNRCEPPKTQPLPHDCQLACTLRPWQPAHTHMYRPPHGPIPPLPTTPYNPPPPPNSYCLTPSA